MKKTLVPIICIIIILSLTFNINKISSYIAKLVSNNHELDKPLINDYAKKQGFKFVQVNDTYIPYSYNDLLNIIYSSINNGWESFTFYCPSEYTDCINDMESISEDDLTLTHINNFVHPFNSFTNLKTSILESGEITLNISYLYQEDEIKQINQKVDEILNTTIKDDDTDYNKIKKLHDYLINNTKYDVQRNEQGDSPYKSYTAYGTLFEHYATCNGYTDAMAIFLDRLNITNYKIATTPESISYKSTGHVWNAVYLDGKWLHLDLTWDDPVSDDGQDYLYHKYLLVTNEDLIKADTGDVVIEEHNFNKAIYLEFNDSINSQISS